MPSKGKTLLQDKCGKYNHISAMCRQGKFSKGSKNPITDKQKRGQVNSATNEDTVNNSDSDYSMMVSGLTKIPKTKIAVNGILIEMLIAQVNL